MRKKIISLLAAAALIAVLTACGDAVPESPYPATEMEVTTQPIIDVIEDAVTEDASIAATTIAFDVYSRILDQLQSSYDVDFLTVTDIYFNGESITLSIEGNVRVTVDGDTVHTALTVEMGEMMEDIFGGMFGSAAEFHMVTEGDEVTSLRVSIGGWEIPLDAFADIGDIRELFDFDEFSDILSAVELPDINIDSILSVEIEETDNTTTIIMTVGGQATLDLALSMIEDNMQDENFVLDDIQVTIVTDADGNPMTVSMTMGASAEVDGDAFRMSFSSEFIFNTVVESAAL